MLMDVVMGCLEKEKFSRLKAESLLEIPWILSIYDPYEMMNNKYIDNRQKWMSLNEKLLIAIFIDHNNASIKIDKKLISKQSYESCINDKPIGLKDIHVRRSRRSNDLGRDSNVQNSVNVSNNLRNSSQVNPSISNQLNQISNQIRGNWSFNNDIEVESINHNSINVHMNNSQKEHFLSSRLNHDFGTERN